MKGQREILWLGPETEAKVPECVRPFFFSQVVYAHSGDSQCVTYCIWLRTVLRVLYF